MKILPLAGALVAAVAVGGLAYWAGTKNAPAPASAAAPAKGSGGPPPVTVEASKVSVARLPESIVTVGSLRSDETIIVRPEITGRVAELLFTEGHRVARGDPLVRLDQSIQKADLERARANLVLSKSKFDRAVDLRAKGFISSQAQDEAENAFKVAQADAELAAARLSKMEIRAPFAGVIGLRSVSVGDYVKEGQDIVNLEAIDPLKLDFRVPELALPQVRAGQALQVTLDALPDRVYPGTVTAINPLIDANGRSIVIRARVSNADGRLRPGMFARVRLLTSEVRDTLVVPEEAVFPVGDDKFVYKVVDGRAQRQKVDLGQRREGRVQVLAGLTAEETVVTAGALKLREGASVKVVTAPVPAPAPKAESAPPAAKRS